MTSLIELTVVNAHGGWQMKRIVCLLNYNRPNEENTTKSQRYTSPVVRRNQFMFVNETFSRHLAVQQSAELEEEEVDSHTDSEVCYEVFTAFEPATV